MSDAARIDRITTKLRILWGMQPDKRLVQLLLNSLPVEVGSPYYVEDDVLEMELDKRLGTGNEKAGIVSGNDRASESRGSA